MAGIEVITHEGTLLALILPCTFNDPGIHFFTPNEFSQQLAFMYYEPGKTIPAHVHNPVAREVTHTQETHFIRKGRIRVDFYASDRRYLESRVLATGDVILLIQGGHGFEVLEPLEMIEVKQGPYTGDGDRTRFNSEWP